MSQYRELLDGCLNRGHALLETLALFGARVEVVHVLAHNAHGADEALEVLCVLLHGLLQALQMLLVSLEALTLLFKLWVALTARSSNARYRASYLLEHRHRSLKERGEEQRPRSH